VISCDDQGDLHVTTNHRDATDGGPVRGIFWILLFSVLFFAPLFGMVAGTGLRPLLRQIEDSGIDDAFQYGVRELLQPGTSALFLAVDEATVPAGAVEAALARFGGTVVSANLPAQAEAELQRALYGAPAAPTSRRGPGWAERASGRPDGRRSSSGRDEPLPP
jgi:uncharacterized membrane protein